MIQSIRNGYIIAALPRTGSFLLCESLRMTGVAGYPQEYGEASEVATWHLFHGCTTHIQYFYRYFDLCTSPNGIFGAKLMWPQFEALCRDIRFYLNIRGPGLEPLEALIGNIDIIFLQRRDRLAQAISLVRAMATGRWASPQEEAGIPQYDRAQIDWALRKLDADKLMWEQWFRNIGLSPLCVWYEDLAKDTLLITREILQYLEIPLPANISNPRVLQRQSDALSESWYARYRTES